jgi:hypothetical protein
MSIPVEVEALPETIARYGPATFLLTTSDDGRPHATHVVVEVDGPRLRCPLGRRTARNGTAQPLVSFLWPPDEPGGYSLIVDGEIAVEPAVGDGDARGVITATKAVLHRPAPVEGAEEAACGSDCLKIDIPEGQDAADDVTTSAASDSAAGA